MPKHTLSVLAIWAAFALAPRVAHAQFSVQAGGLSGSIASTGIVFGGMTGDLETDATFLNWIDATHTMNVQNLNVLGTCTGCGGMAIGGAISGGATPGSALFVGAGPVLAQDNANYNYTSPAGIGGPLFAVGQGDQSKFVNSDWGVSGIALGPFASSGNASSDLYLVGLNSPTDILGVNYQGTLASPTTTGANQDISRYSGFGYDASNHYREAASVALLTDGAPSIHAVPGKISLRTFSSNNEQAGYELDSRSFSNFYGRAIVNPMSAVGGVTFAGSGLNDATSGGPYTGGSQIDLCAKIDGTGTPDTFTWGDDVGCSNGAAGVAITGSAQSLLDGVTITFDATTGHTLNDKWSWTAYPADGIVINDALGGIAFQTGVGKWTKTAASAGATLFEIDNSGKADTYDGLTLAGMGLPAVVGSVRAVAQVAAITTTTAFTTGASDAEFEANFAIDCTTTSAAATVNVTIGWTDTGNHAQTQTLGSAIVCTTLGAASYGSLSLNFNVKAATNITYATSIANTPTYDIRGTVRQLTIN